MKHGDSDKEEYAVEEWETCEPEKKETRSPEVCKPREEENPDLRAPICCVLGHVDTGKTKLLDAIRETNVQEGEAGGITQQIGATYFPTASLRQKTEKVVSGFDFAVPGLLVIDTPGHESFTNLRARGSSLCNIAVLVVDIMHGIEPQTRESIMLLRERKTPFIVALNKIDRLYGWEANKDISVKKNLERQKKNVKTEFEDRLAGIVGQFASEGMNAELYTRNKDIRRTVSLIPTSAVTGDGVADLVLVVCMVTQKMMRKDLQYVSAVECTVLEVKMVEGLGTTIDVILSNGRLYEGDTIVLCGISGPIVTNIRALLTPQAMKELRVKSQYVHNKSVCASLGVKIFAPGLESAVAGSRLFVGSTEEEIAEAKELAVQDFASVFRDIKLETKGVSVQASTLGSLEALLTFLRSKDISCMRAGIGTLYKKDVLLAATASKEDSAVLCFDVRVDSEAAEVAAREGVTLLTGDIIYNLFDMLLVYREGVRASKKKRLAAQAVFPCVLGIVPGCVFNKKDPIVVGVSVLEGVLHVGTPLCVVEKDKRVSIGRVTSIEKNHVAVQTLRVGEAAVKIEMAGGSTPMVGRSFEEKARLYSQITRESIDVLKDSFREEMLKEDWALVKKLKAVFGIL
ncbi:MAG: translation initiation factor eIF5B [Amphiamblys sp. WSBS2006]|nr:MAG: translation initiation factor eIF5B [Amphiamblys sp. WSBS2006]